MKLYQTFNKLSQKAQMAAVKCCTGVVVLVVLALAIFSCAAVADHGYNLRLSNATNSIVMSTVIDSLPTAEENFFLCRKTRREILAAIELSAPEWGVKYATCTPETEHVINL